VHTHKLSQITLSPAAPAHNAAHLNGRGPKSLCINTAVHRMNSSLQSIVLWSTHAPVRMPFKTVTCQNSAHHHATSHLTLNLHSMSRMRQLASTRALCMNTCQQRLTPAVAGTTVSQFADRFSVAPRTEKVISYCKSDWQHDSCTDHKVGHHNTSKRTASNCRTSAERTLQSCLLLFHSCCDVLAHDLCTDCDAMNGSGSLCTV
jgi:hypothetical protein